MRFMLDTNICIYLIKRKPPQVLERLRSLSIDDVAISSITLAELAYGVVKSSRPEQNDQALQAFLAPWRLSALMTGRLAATAKSAPTWKSGGPPLERWTC